MAPVKSWLHRLRLPIKSFFPDTPMVLSLTGRASVLPVLLSCFLPLVMVACGEKQTPEQQVRQYIAFAEDAVEKRDVIDLGKLISDQYTDSGRRDRRALVGLAAGYFLRHKNIHLFTRIKDIDFPAPDTASVELYVAMTGSPVTGAQALIDLRADLMKFNLTLKSDGDEWLLSETSWEHANIDELLGGE